MCLDLFREESQMYSDLQNEVLKILHRAER